MADNVSNIRSRNPDETRQQLLEAAMEEILLHGFQAASLDRILKRTGLTKGALYHHFKNKKELGYAVVDQFIRQNIMEKWVQPLEHSTDPIDTLMQLIIQSREDVETRFANGCPLVTIGHEMSGLDEGFRERVDTIYDIWTESISKALLKGQMEGKVSRTIAPDQVAAFFVAAAEGSLVLNKVSRSDKKMANVALAMMHYLTSLRP